MIIYNITTQVSHAIAENWLQWLKTEHIPQIMESGCFIEFTIVKLLETDESEGLTYAVQYKAESKADYNRYIELYAPALRKASTDRWGDNFISFRSVLEVVN